MQTKSNIQLIGEMCNIVSDYKAGLNNLMDKYTIEDSVFVYRNGQLFEAVAGYFVTKGEFENIDEAVRDCWGNFNCMGVRIENNEKFTSGWIKKTILECGEDSKVFDIERLTEVR